MSRAWADVSLDAVRANVTELRRIAAPAEVCAVVKADGYGHGAVPVARAALEAGATWLAVAQVPEAAPLRDQGIAAPILLLSQPRPDELADAIALDVDITVYSPGMVDRLGAAAADGHRVVPVHLKVDTGMRRVGVEPADALAVASSIAAHPSLALASVWTHCPVADDPDPTFTDQAAGALRRPAGRARCRGDRGPAAPRRQLGRRHRPPEGSVRPRALRHRRLRHPAGTGGWTGWPRWSRWSAWPRRWASSRRWRRETACPTGCAIASTTTPSSPRCRSGTPTAWPGVSGLAGQEVLIGGRRHPMVGAVTMDQVMVDVGPGSDVRPGDEAVLLGSQGDERITPDEWAARLDTISYEVVCAIGARVERRYSSS